MNTSNEQLDHKNQDQSAFDPKTAIVLNLLQENHLNLSHSENELAATKYSLFDYELVHHLLSQYHEAY